VHGFASVVSVEIVELLWPNYTLHNPNCITTFPKPQLCSILPLLFFTLQLYGCKLVFNACCVELNCNEALLLCKSKTLPFIINIACIKKIETKLELNKGYQKMEGFRELYNNTVPKKHDSQNNTPLNITPLMHVSDSFYIECPPEFRYHTLLLLMMHSILKSSKFLQLLCLF
jgi:hypothetical protein